MSHEIWSPQDIPRDSTLHYMLGPLDLRVSRSPQEWSFRYRYGSERLVSAAPTVRLIHEPFETDETGWRYGRVTESDDPSHHQLQLAGVCADRPILARPRTPVQIGSGSTVHFYVTTPTWVRIDKLPGPTDIFMLPTWEASNSWLGPPTGDGPLCYATKTNAVLSLDELPHYAMRTITHTVIRNDGPRIDIDRIIIPAPHLQLYAGADGQLWTESVTMSRSRDGELDSVVVGEKPPALAGPCTPISTRASDGSGAPHLRRLMSRLFG